jgi:hypothetical protein
VLAAHYLRNCEHVVEIGGHERPITSFLTHHPRSVTSVDPKTPALEARHLMESLAVFAISRGNFSKSSLILSRNPMGWSCWDIR